MDDANDRMLGQEIAKMRRRKRIGWAFMFSLMGPTAFLGGLGTLIGLLLWPLVYLVLKARRSHGEKLLESQVSGATMADAFHGADMASVPKLFWPWR